MSEEITKDNAHKLGASYYRTVQEACEETRRDENHSIFLEAEKENAWNGTTCTDFSTTDDHPLLSNLPCLEWRKQGV